jgi:DNA gyrase inhibitor GyrI
MVTLTISLVYATNALTATQVIVTLPSDAPTPLQPAGLTSASNGLYAAIVATQQSATGAPLANTPRALFRNNSSNNGYEIIAAFSASTIVNTFIQVQYIAQ